jgi:small-conductance mechanosensitive channel
MLNTVRSAVVRHAALLPLIAALTLGAAATAAPALKSAPAARPGMAAKAEATSAEPPTNAAPTSAAASSPAPGAAPAAAAPVQAAPVLAAPVQAAPDPPPLTGPQVIQLLDQTIDWYRSLGIQQQTANEPSDLLILYDNRQTASRVIALAFEIARADADMLAKQPVADSGATADATSQSLAQTQNKFVAQGSEVQEQLADAQRSLGSARGNDAVKLKAKISELQGELDLINTRKTLLATLMSISNESDANGFSAASLKAQIDAMAITVPASSGSTASAAAATGAAPASSQSLPGASAAAPPAPLGTPSVSIAARFGIWDLAANVFRLSEKIATIDDLDRRTAALEDAFAQIRGPLINRMRGLSTRGDALATQADGADAGTLTQMRIQLDALAEQIKLDSGLLIPLGKEGVLLAQHRRNLANWHGIIANQYTRALKTLGVRLAILTVLLAVVFIAAELWRRAVMNYVRDSRRRYQLLLLRRIALWSLTILIIGFAFASELGSLVTFAGLITAGLAVAMQSVLVSIVGYFFLIGKYGVRVGDRVQIGEVTGEVIELGLVRLHLMEIGGHGQFGPTGRVVAFANSIVFQVASGLFKQIPGVNFAWHEISLTLPAGSDYATAKDKLMAAVTTALKDSRDEFLRQTKEIERTTASSFSGDSQPRVQLNFVGSGLEAKIRYPVHLSNAAEIDDKVSQELIRVIAGAVPAGAVQAGAVSAGAAPADLGPPPLASSKPA